MQSFMLTAHTEEKALDCSDELPNDYLDSICFNQWNFTSCEKIMKDVSGCNDLWLDTECTNHTGYIRDTCQKSCGNCKGVHLVDIYLNDFVKMSVSVTL